MAPRAGTVTMDMTMIDVTTVRCEVGDIATLIGRAGDTVLTVERVADALGVLEAWRIVDPVLRAKTPVHEYLPGTWGPPEVQLVSPAGGWHNPVVES